MDRSTKNIPKLRAYCSWHVLERIVRQSCLHIDVWLVQDGDDRLYFMTETRVAGLKLVETIFLQVTPLGAVRVPNYTVTRDTLVTRHLNTAWSRRYPWLRALYRDKLQPGLVAPAPYKSVSVRLHCISSKACVTDPTLGLVNVYAETRRAARDRAMAGESLSVRDTRRAARRQAPPLAETGERLPAREAPPRKLSRADRSRLRTLDKLLGLA